MSDEATFKPKASEEMAILVATLYGAQERLYAARKAESAVNSELNLAINEVNRAQSMLDTAVAQLKSAAGDGTDWARGRYGPGMKAAGMVLLALLCVGCASEPTPVATPTPAPSVAPVVVAQAFNAATACGFGPNPTARIARCERISGGIRGDFSGAVEAAQAAINERTRPAMFFCPSDPKQPCRIRSEAEYTSALVDHIGRAGFCAVMDNGDTLLVKVNDSFSEEFDVVRVDGGDNYPVPVGSLRQKCRPASF